MKSIYFLPIVIFSLMSLMATAAQPTTILGAIKKNNETQLKKLLNTNGGINKKDRKGDAPLHIMAKLNNEKMIKFTLKEGANIEIKNKKG